VLSFVEALWSELDFYRQKKRSQVLEKRYRFLHEDSVCLVRLDWFSVRSKGANFGEDWVFKKREFSYTLLPPFQQRQRLSWKKKSTLEGQSFDVLLVTIATVHGNLCTHPLVNLLLFAGINAWPVVINYLWPAILIKKRVFHVNVPRDI
jgi:hypothetical protein